MYGSVALLSAVNVRQYVNECILLDVTCRHGGIYQDNTHDSTSLLCNLVEI